MDADREIDIKYASDYASLANGWKYFIGQDKGVKDLDVVGDKANFEEEFMRWVDADPDRKAEYGNVISDMESVYNERSPKIGPLIYASLTGIGGAGIIDFASEFAGLEGLMTQQKEDKDKEKKAKKGEKIAESADGMKESVAAHFEDYDMATDKETFAVMTKMYYEKMPADMHPEILDKMQAKFKGDFYAYADYVFEHSFFADQESTEAFLGDPDLKVLHKDPAFKLMQGYMEGIMQASGAYRQGGEKLSTAERKFVKAVREMILADDVDGRRDDAIAPILQ